MHRSQSSQAFTLLEILVVVLIITILATVVGVQLAHEPGRARIAAATAQIRVLRTSLERFRLDQGRLPTQREGLRALVRPPDTLPRPDAWPQGGYLDRRELPDDPWGNEYVYLVPGRDGMPFEIVSYGADGEPGGEGEAADLSSAD